MSRESDLAPRDAPQSKTQPRFTMSVGRMMRVVFFLGCFFAVVALVGRAAGRAREEARRANCLGHFSQIGLALHNYHSIHGVFPPGYIADEHGRPLHSWRVLILPYLGEQGLYARYDFSEPWDGPNNIQLLGLMPAIFACPSRDAAGSAPTTLTSYVVVSGPGTMFPGAESIRLDQVTDDPASTLMLVEVENVRIAWTKPEDLDLRTMSLQINDERKPGISSDHPGGANAAFGNRSYRFLPNSMTASHLRSLLTSSGGEVVPAD